jgi:hypothetical protein
MRTCLGLLLVLAIATPAVAQTPIRETVIVATDLDVAPPRPVDDDHRGHHHTRDAVLFWSGVTLIAVGAIAVIGSVTWAQQSDLRNEFQSVHLGRDILPCGTDPTNATLPIAECKTHTPLLWIGSGLAVAGTGLVTFSLVTDPYHRAEHAPLLRVRLRF